MIKEEVLENVDMYTIYAALRYFDKNPRRNIVLIEDDGRFFRFTKDKLLSRLIQSKLVSTFASDLDMYIAYRNFIINKRI